MGSAAIGVGCLCRLPRQFALRRRQSGVSRASRRRGALRVTAIGRRSRSADTLERAVRIYRAIQRTGWRRNRSLRGANCHGCRRKRRLARSRTRVRADARPRRCTLVWRCISGRAGRGKRWQQCDDERRAARRRFLGGRRFRRRGSEAPPRQRVQQEDKDERCNGGCMAPPRRIGLAALSGGRARQLVKGR